MEHKSQQSKPSSPILWLHAQLRDMITEPGSSIFVSVSQMCQSLFSRHRHAIFQWRMSVRFGGCARLSQRFTLSPGIHQARSNLSYDGKWSIIGDSWISNHIRFPDKNLQLPLNRCQELPQHRKHKTRRWLEVWVRTEKGHPCATIGMERPLATWPCTEKTPQTSVTVAFRVEEVGHSDVMNHGQNPCPLVPQFLH